MIATYLHALLTMLTEMAPYLILGFLIAGILHVYIPGHVLARWLGGNDLKSVVYASMIGVPLPLCSCGVIPAGLSIHREGASKGSTVSFLISTPQTGVDSILVTYSLLGLPLAVLRPIIAFATGILGGWAVNLFAPGTGRQAKVLSRSAVGGSRVKNPGGVFSYAFGSFMDEIADWLIIGLILAAVIAVLIPDDFFQSAVFSGTFTGMLIILAASVPFYICATGSVPIAAALMMKGLDVGSVVVFLMAGPATNIASLILISKNLGMRVASIYLSAIISGALISGLAINEFLPASLFTTPIATDGLHSGHGLNTIGWISAIILLALLARIYFIRLQRYRRRSGVSENSGKQTLKLEVEGMTCNNCVARVESALSDIHELESIRADFKSNTVVVQGKDIDIAQLKERINKTGYIFKR